MVQVFVEHLKYLLKPYVICNAGLRQVLDHHEQAVVAGLIGLAALQLCPLDYKLTRCFVQGYIKSRREAWQVVGDEFNIANKNRFKWDDMPSVRWVQTLVANHAFLQSVRKEAMKLMDKELTEYNLCRFFETILCVGHEVPRSNTFNADESGIKATFMSSKVS